MRLFLSETQLIAGGMLLGLGIFVGSLVNAAPPRFKAKPSKKVVSKNYPSKQPRRRWDSNLSAHPSRSTYRRRLMVRATAYQPIDDPMEGGRWTKTERDGRAVHGVAVDPRVIPLGTRLWIPGYGHAIADDIGSAIKGKRVDLRMQSAVNMHRWGIRQVSVYVLK